MQKGKTAEEIAEILEEDKDTVDRLMLKIKKKATGQEQKNEKTGTENREYLEYAGLV